MLKCPSLSLQQMSHACGTVEFFEAQEQLRFRLLDLDYGALIDRDLNRFFATLAHANAHEIRRTNGKVCSAYSRALKRINFLITVYSLLTLTKLKKPY